MSEQIKVEKMSTTEARLFASFFVNMPKLVSTTQATLMSMLNKSFDKLFKKSGYFGTEQEAEEKRKEILATASSKIEAFHIFPILFASLINPVKYVQILVVYVYHVFFLIVPRSL